MYQRILLPTDGSDPSQRAILAGIDFARSVGAKVVTMTAVPEFHTFTMSSDMLAHTTEQYDAQSRARGQRLLDEVAALARDAAVPCSTVVVTWDHPYEAIISTARAKLCDLIIMASHGRRGIKALLLGSETQKVLVHSAIPVLVHR